MIFYTQAMVWEKIQPTKQTLAGGIQTTNHIFLRIGSHFVPETDNVRGFAVTRTSV
jgi:hypothetical protein